MSRYTKALKDWVSAGLIAEGQADAIAAYEARRRQGHFGRGLVGLSLLAILIGILSVIAANWHQIPGFVKIGAHVFLNIGVGITAWRFSKTSKDLWREGAVFAFLGLTLTLIVLIGQVYQLGGEGADAFLLWLIITLPFFLLLGNSYMSAVPWMAGFLATVGFAIAQKLEVLPPQDRFLLGFGICVLLPLAMMADGKVAIFEKWRPALANASLQCGAVLLATWSSLSLGFWHRTASVVGGHYDFTARTLIVLLAGLIGIGIHAAFYKCYKSDERMKIGALYGLISLVSICLPLLIYIDFPGRSLLAALAFIAYWIFIGWVGQTLLTLQLVSLAITVIAVRIFLLYIELFGSLMSTGIGLISGGIVMLGLIYAARKLNERITKKGHPA